MRTNEETTMTELSVQEKLILLQRMGKLPYDYTQVPTLDEYLHLAMELADCKTKIANANKILDEFDRADKENFEHQDRNYRLRQALNCVEESSKKETTK